jgi:hypothetical protein
LTVYSTFFKGFSMLVLLKPYHLHSLPLIKEPKVVLST